MKSEAIQSTIKSEHNNEYLSKCDICEKTFGSNKLLKRHLVTHQLDRQKFPCKFCDKTYKNKQGLTLHSRSVHEEMKYKCQNCFKVFKSKPSLKIHFETKHSSKPLVRCDTCNKEFAHKRYLDAHIRIAHKISESHECTYCHKGFTIKTNLNHHIRNVHEKVKRYKCDLCEKSFAVKYWFDYHLRHVHENMKDVKCQFCDKFFTEDYFPTHVKLVHQNGTKGFENFKCNTCNIEFSSRITLKHHVARIHGEKALKCENCDKTFDTQNVLNTTPILKQFI